MGLSEELRLREEVSIKIIEQGFIYNHKQINGFIPHFIKEENTCLFLIGKDFWNSKIVTIHHHFKTIPDREFNVFGLLLPNAPAWAEMDWVVGSRLNLVRFNPNLEIMEYSKEHSKAIYKPFSFN